MEIKKGKHRSGLHFGLHKSKQFKYIANFKKAWFEKRNADDEDINKLCGFSYGWHHNDSFRIGWKPDFAIPGMINLYAYWYNKGKRFNSKFITTVCENEDLIIKINVCARIV